jgi:hypothetical protein
MDELSGEHELPTEQAASATPPTSCHEPGRSEQFPAVRSLRVGGDHRLPLPARELGSIHPGPALPPQGNRLSELGRTTAYKEAAITQVRTGRRTLLLGRPHPRRRSLFEAVEW